MSLTLRDGIVIVLLIAAILSAMAAVRHFSRRAALPAEVQRKLIHVATGATAVTFPLLFDNPLPVLVLMGLSIAVMFALRHGLIPGLGSVLHGVERQSHGEIYLALAIAITFLRAQEEPVLYVLPILVITLSDTASALVGTSYGRRRFLVEDGAKSIEGVVAFVVVTWLCALIALLLLTDAPHINIVLLAPLIAGFCALVEADSWRGLDNLFVPVGAFLLLARYLDSSPFELAFTAATFLVLLVAIVGIAPALKLKAQAARAYGILIFLIISIAGIHNVVLPCATIALHLLARAWRRGNSERPDLDLLFAAAMAALMWLFIGDALHRSAISLFNLTFAGAAIAFAALALQGHARWLLIPLAALLAALSMWAADANLPYSHWFMPSWSGIGVALLVAVTPPFLRPSWFTNYRSFKIFGLAILIPLALCLKGALVP